MFKKISQLVAATILAAIVLVAFKPVIAWASQEGSYLYHQFFLTGPAVIYGAGSSYTGSDGTARQGLTITTGTPTAMTGVASIRFLGVQASSPTSASEGDQYYDLGQHSMYFASMTFTVAQGLTMTGWKAY